MTDAEWEVLGPQARAVMAELRHGPGGRPMAHRLRAVVDAIRYLVRYGVEWRALPVGFSPPWQAVYAFFERWAARGLPQRVVDRLRGQLRVGAGRAELPTAAVIDSQSVKAADTVGAATSGFDGGNHAGRAVTPGSLLPVGDPRPHEHAHQGQQRLTCEDAGSWTHACLSAVTRGGSDPRQGDECGDAGVDLAPRLALRQGEPALTRAHRGRSNVRGA